MADRPRTFTTEHAARSTLRYHHHGIAFATIVLEGAYTEVRDGVPRVCPAGTVVLHDPHEEHADYFTRATRCLNVEFDEVALRRARALREPHGAAALPGWLRHTLDAFEWAGPAPLRDAARMAGLHQTHFCREFRRVLGTTPGAFRRRARLDRASALLVASDASLAGIAQACGFSDQSHLTRTFAGTLGLAPAAYRRAFAR
ncbi:MAG TPA: helix-turn-helix transcriptional regulator [Candidatus Sulfotelmatobacter sp.]|nr:helix-turn-helix transcriptional regulator [Candidatus Sulfotelmatobacter sp.]